MLPVTLLVSVLALTLLAAGTPVRRAEAFFPPPNGGGSELDVATTDNPPLGEPLNVIISGLSSPAVLTNDGFLNFAQAIGL